MTAWRRFLTFPPLPRNGRFDPFRTVASARMKLGRLQPPDPRTFRSDPGDEHRAWNRFATNTGLVRSLCAVAWAPASSAP